MQEHRKQLLDVSGNAVGFSGHSTKLKLAEPDLQFQEFLEFQFASSHSSYYESAAKTLPNVSLEKGQTYKR